jgi:hypothetical protein
VVLTVACAGEVAVLVEFVGNVVLGRWWEVMVMFAVEVFPIF